MKLTPAQRRAIRRARPKDREPSEDEGELNIVPFLDIVVNLMLFLLATSTSVLAIAQVEAQLPSLSPRPGPGVERGLSLSVTLTSRGAVVATSAGRLERGCGGRAAGPSISVPARAGGGQDWAALGACLERIKAAYPEEREVTLSADPEVPYEDVIAAMDAMRGGPEGALFGEVRLSAGVR